MHSDAFMHVINLNYFQKVGMPSDYSTQITNFN